MNLFVPDQVKEIVENEDLIEANRREELREQARVLFASKKEEEEVNSILNDLPTHISDEEDEMEAEEENKSPLQYTHEIIEHDLSLSEESVGSPEVEHVHSIIESMPNVTEME